MGKISKIFLTRVGKHRETCEKHKVAWTEFIHKHSRQTAFACFNNDVYNRAPHNGIALIHMVGKRAEEANSQACATMALK